jgi:hypothetical protein
MLTLEPQLEEMTHKETCRYCLLKRSRHMLDELGVCDTCNFLLTRPYELTNFDSTK